MPRWSYKVNRECPTCGVIMSYGAKKCSACYWNSIKGRKAWNKGKKLDAQYKAKVVKSLVPFVKGHTTNIGRKPWNAGMGNVPLHRQIRQTGLYRLWYKTVFNMGYGRCIVCHSTTKLEAHHIISFRDLIIGYRIKTVEQAKLTPALWNIYNGVMLCQKCHGRPGPPKS